MDRDFDSSGSGSGSDTGEAEGEAGMFDSFARETAADSTAFKADDPSLGALRAALQAAVLAFVDDISHSVFDDSCEMLTVQVVFAEFKPPKVAKLVMRHLLPFHAQIRARDEEFFYTSRAGIFGKLGKERIERMARLVALSPAEGGLSVDARSKIWAHFDVLLDIIKAYIELWWD